MKAIKEKIIDRAIQFFVNQNHPPFQIFWTLVIYSKLHIQVTSYEAQVFFILGILYAVVFRCNHFYLYSPVLNAGIGTLAFINLLLGILAANQKWKFYLFIFILGQSIFRTYPQALLYYQIFSSLFIAINIYSKLIFVNKKDNIAFFVGFGSLFWISTLQLGLNCFGFDNRISYFFTPLAIYSCYIAINRKFCVLTHSNIDDFKQPQVLIQYLQIFQQNLSKSAGNKIQMLCNHEIRCENPQCQCKIVQQREDMKNYKIVSSLYEQILCRLNKEDQNLIFQKYIKYKIKHGQVGKAIILNATNKFRTSNIYRVIDRVKNSFEIKKLILKLQYFGQNTIGIEKLLQYDAHYVDLINQIKKNIQSKIKYWIQVGKEQPVLNKLQQLGFKLNNDLQKLHYFFQQKVEPIQKQFKFYAGSIIYAIYLQGTSNYKEYSDSLIKQVIRTFDSIKFSDQKVYETYAIQLKFQATFANKMFEVSNEGSFQSFELCVTSVSSICSQFLKIKRHQLIGSSINRIIPQIYQQKHNQGIANIFKLNNQHQFNDFKFLGKSNYVPIKLGNGQISRVRIKSILSPTCFNQLFLVCIMQKTLPQVQISLIDFRGKNLAKNKLDQVLNSIISDQKTRIQLDRVEFGWMQNKQIERNCYFYQRESRYQITIDSPFARCFRSQPPLHFQYTCTTQNQQTEKQKRKQLDFFRGKLTQNMQIIEGQPNQGATTSKNNNLVILLTEFQNTSSIIFFKKYMAFFALIAVLGALLMSICYNTISLNWDKSQDRFNPYNNIDSVARIQRNLIYIISRSQDIEEFKQGRNSVEDMRVGFTQAQINRKAIIDYGSDIYPKIKKQISEDIIYISDILKPNFQRYLSRELDIKNPKAIVGKASTQKMRIRNILTSYLADVNILIKEKDISQTILSHSYLFQVHPLLQQLQQQNQIVIQQSFRTVFLINIIFTIASTIVIIVTLIPLYRFKIAYEKKIQDFFNLIVSIKGQQIESQINVDLNMLAAISRSHQVNQSVQIRTLKQINLLEQNIGMPKYLQYGNDQGQLPEEAKFLSYEIHGPLRKREGQLQNVHIKNYTNAILFAVVMVLAAFLVAIETTKLTGIFVTEKQIKLGLKKMNRLTSMSYLLANTKDYIYKGDREIESGVLLSSWIQNQLELQMEEINYQTEQVLISNIVPGQDSFMIVKRQNRSQQLSIGLFYNHIKKAFLAKKTNNPFVLQYRRGLIYAQTVCQDAEGIGLGQLNTQHIKSVNFVQKSELIYFNIYIFGLVWCVIGFLAGIFLIRKLNISYVEQVTMISFLNSQMIANNKRIQSFLEKISKGLQ